MGDFMTIKNEWRDQLLKEYAEQEFEDDGTMLEVNIDTGDEDECCEMIKQKYSDTLDTQFWLGSKGKHILMNQFDSYGIDCDRIKMQLEKNAYEYKPTYLPEPPRNPEAARRRMAKYKAIVDEWEECEKQKNSWKNKLR